MNNENEIVVNGVVYVKKDQNKDGQIKIAILQRGWAMIGRFKRDGQDCTLTDAHVIRRWGTTKGLGQLALEGKQSNTVLDEAGTVEFDYLTVVSLISCDSNKWAAIL